MKRALLISTLLATLLAGCASQEEQTTTAAPTNTDPRLMDCSLPTVKDRGPVRPSLFVVGTFPDGQWIHMENRKMGHKGDGLYQVVSEEKAGKVSLQFATMSWNPQYTAAGKELIVGQEKVLKRGGFAKNTVVSLPVDGKYLWSIQLSADKKPIKAMVAQCK